MLTTGEDECSSYRQEKQPDGKLSAPSNETAVALVCLVRMAEQPIVAGLAAVCMRAASDGRKGG